MSIRELTKRLLKSYALGRLVYEPIHSLWRMYNIPRQRRRLQKYGDETIKLLHTFFKKNKVEYYLDWGTLLGIIREEGFIKHDDDIDITIRHSPITPKQLLERLSTNGFSFVHGFFAQGKTIEATIVRKGLTVDLFFGEDSTDRADTFELYDSIYDPSIDYPSPNANSWRTWFFPKSIRVQDYKFHGYNICIPEEPEMMLSLEYGSNWRIPIEKFEYKQDDLHFKKNSGYSYRVLSLNELPK